MRKCTTIILIFFILLSFYSISCNVENDRAYHSFIFDSATDAYSVNSELDYWTGVDFKKGDMVDKSCVVLGNIYSGSYNRSITDKMNSYTTDIYIDKNNIEFGLRDDTGELAYINLMNANFFDTQPYLPEVNNPTETAISLATEIAGKYVDNIKEYTQISDKPVTRYKERDGETYKITYYAVTFAKKIDGYFTSDYIAVKVTSKGTLASIMMGDIDAFTDTPINFDITAVNQSISKKIESTYTKAKLKVEKTNIDDQKIVLTPDGDIGMYSRIVIDGIDGSNVKVQTGVCILTILEKRIK